MSVLCPLAFGGKERSVYFAHCSDGAFKTLREALAGKFVEEGLGIKKVEVTGTAFHEKKNHVAGLSNSVWNLNVDRIG